MELSARNQLKGRVTEVKTGEVMAEVTLEIAGGQTVTAAIARGSVERMNIMVGDQVTAIIKATEVMIGT